MDDSHDQLDPTPRPSYAPTERIGDAERERAVGALSEHYAVGRLDRAELDTRVDAAYRARTLDELRALFGDLPEPAPFRPPAPKRPGTAPREARRRVVVPVLPLLIALAVVLMVASGGRAFFVFPMLWFWLGFGRRAWGSPHHHPRG